MRRTILPFFLFIFWAVLILSGYFVFHKPGLDSLPPPLDLVFPGWTAFGLHWMSLFKDLIAALGIILACLGLGRLILGRFHLDGLDGLAIQTALGCGVYALVWLGLSAMGLVNIWTAWLILILSLLILRKEIRSGLDQIGDLKDYWSFAGKLERFFFIAAAILAINQVWAALAPPVKYDALTYHLSIPQKIVSTGRMSYSPANPYWGHPQVAEMIFTWAMRLGRPETAALAGWMFGLIAIIGIAGLSVRWLPDSSDPRRISAAAGMALVALFTASSVRWMSAWAYTDLFSALMGLGGLLCFFAWRDSARRGWLLWMGLFIGLAVGTKYTAGILALLLYPAAFLSPESNRKPFLSILMSGFIALLVFAPWAIKNTAYTGNPLFPYVFNTAEYNKARLAAANLPPEHVDWLSEATLPISYTWAGIDTAPGSGTDLGPLLILFAIPALITFHFSTRARIIAAGLLLCWLFISLGGARFDHLHQPRLYFVLLPALGCAAGWGWTAVQGVEAGGLRLRRIGGALVVLAISLILISDLPRPIASGAFQTAIGLRAPETYLYDNTGAYFEAMQTLAALPPDSRVLMLWEARSLYAPKNTIPDPWLDRWRTDLREMGSAENVLALWKRNSYTHILLFSDGMQWMRSSDRNLSKNDWQAFDNLFTNLPAPHALTGDHYLIYKLP